MENKYGENAKDKSTWMTITNRAKNPKILTLLLISSTICLVVYSSTMLALHGVSTRFVFAADFLVFCQSSIFISVILIISMFIKMSKIYLKIIRILTISVLFGQLVGFLSVGVYTGRYLRSDEKLEELVEKFGVEELHRSNFKFMIDLMVLQEEVSCCGLKSVHDWRGIRLLNEIGGPTYIPDSCCKKSKDIYSLCGDKNRKKDIHTKGCSKWLLADARLEPKRLFLESVGGFLVVGFCILFVMLLSTCWVTQDQDRRKRIERGYIAARSQGQEKGQVKKGDKKSGAFDFDVNNGNVGSRPKTAESQNGNGMVQIVENF